MAAGSLTLGGNLSIAVGPLGRNAEGTGALNTKGKMAAMYSYSRTKGLFGGLSVEGSIILERQDANRLAYGGSPTAKQILSGTFDPPQWADVLIEAIERCTGLPGGRKWRSWEEEGEYGDTGAMNPEEWYRQKQAGRKRGDSGAGQGAAGVGYAFGQGVGAGGSGSPGLRPYSPEDKADPFTGTGHGNGSGYGEGGYSGYEDAAALAARERDRQDEKGRKRGSSLGMFDRPLASANPLARLGGSSTPPRPGLSKRTSSFNPFSSKDKDGKSPTSPSIRRGHSHAGSTSGAGSGSGAGSNASGMASSENYNAGLTWDSDGPSTPWATRPRAGTGGSSRSGGLRPAHWDRDAYGAGGAIGAGEVGVRERSYSDPKLSRTAEGFGTGAGASARGGGRTVISLMDDDDEYGNDGPRAGGQNGNDMDDLGARVSGMALGGGSRSRSGSGAIVGNRPRANSRLADSFVPDRHGNDDDDNDYSYKASRSNGHTSREREGGSDPFGSGRTSAHSTPPHSRSHSSTLNSHLTSTSTATSSPSPSTTELGPASTGYARAVALFDLPASQPGDLALKKGQVVYAMDKVGTGEWWRGMNTHGDAGIFPANYVEVLEIPKVLKGGLGRGDLKKRVPELEF